jgi:hypothetical protein
LLLPALSGAKARSKGTECINNLRQVGVGLRLWANDNDDKFPWHVDMAKGGSRDSADWTDNFRVASDELNTPKILACPTDQEKSAARDWQALDGTFHISYFFGRTATESRPQSILAGDRAISGGVCSTCDSRELTWDTSVGSSIDAAFEPTPLHKGSGYIVLADASVHHFKTSELREQIMAALSTGSTNVIFSLPRGVE